MASSTDSSSRPSRVLDGLFGLSGRVLYPLVSVGVVLLILLLWWAVRAFNLLDLFGVTSYDLFVPRIADVWSEFRAIAFGEGYRGLSLWEHVGWSLFRLAIGFGGAIIVGVPLGLLMGTHRLTAAIFDPIIEFYRSLPPLAYYSLLIIWFGIDETSKIVLLFLAALSPIVINTRAGVASIRTTWLEQARCLGASPSYAFWNIMVPGSLPFIFAGLKLSWGFSLSTLVAAELVAATKGIGWMSLDASKFLRTDVVFLAIITMGIIAICMDQLLRYLENRIVPWRGKS